MTIADISGKGVPAAMLSSSLKTLLRSFAEGDENPAALLQHLNKLLFHELKNSGLFITLCAVYLDITYGTLRYAGAGHPQSILLRRHSGEHELLRSTGMPLGILEDSDYTDIQACLAPGDTLVLYSDGIIETHNDENELLGMEGFLHSLAEHSSRPPEDMLKELLSLVADFRGDIPLSDDISLIILQSKDRTIPFSFPAKLENLEEMNSLVARACGCYGEKFAYDLELAASELFSNVIRHSYKDSEGSVWGSLLLTMDDVSLDIYDNAAPFHPDDLPPPDETLPREGNYGLLISRKLCDELVHTPDSIKGNHWHAVKRRTLP